MLGDAPGKRVLIVGASIAGPALAFWLERSGFEVTVLERAPGLREGGHKIDVRGIATRIVRKMGVYDQVREASSDVQSATFVNSAGAVTSHLTAAELGMREPDDVELPRNSLARILYQRTASRCNYLFGHSLDSIQENDSLIRVRLTSGEEREFDMVVGADGFHSQVRSLVFGPESQFSWNLGDYHYAVFSMENYLGLDRAELFYSTTDKLASIGHAKNGRDAQVQMIFRSPGLVYDYRNSAQQKELLADLYGEEGWEVPRFLEGMRLAPDFYFDTVRQIRMNCWGRGRTVLVGDAAYCPCLASGQGATMALVGAYVLADALSSAQGNVQSAFQAYSAKLAEFVRLNQELGASTLAQIVPSGQATLDFLENDLREQFVRASNCLELED